MDEVTIILPCHNSGEHLFPAISSILQNTKYPFKLFLIESESTDKTADICDIYQQAFPDKIKVFHTKKEGLVKAINFGISQCDTDVYLTQDDVILPKLYQRDWLSELVKAKGEGIGLISTIAGGGISGEDYINGMRWIGTWSMYIPRETINKVGLFDEDLGPGDDIDYCYRVYLLGLKIAIANFWVDHHRLTEHMVSNGDSEKLIKLMANKFRKKWSLGEYEKTSSIN